MTLATNKLKLNNKYNQGSVWHMKRMELDIFASVLCNEVKMYKHSVSSSHVLFLTRIEHFLFCSNLSAKH